MDMRNLVKNIPIFIAGWIIFLVYPGFVAALAVTEEIQVTVPLLLFIAVGVFDWLYIIVNAGLAILRQNQRMIWAAAFIVLSAWLCMTALTIILKPEVYAILVVAVLMTAIYSLFFSKRK